MSSFRSVLAAVLLLAAFALPAGGAEAAHRDNQATAVIEQDDGWAFDFAWDVSRQRGGVVDHSNAAHAAARCTRCRATAIAFQIVIASAATRVAPTNEAVALNHQCTECLVIAEARQFVRVVDAPVRLTGEGRQRLRAVRQALEQLDDAQMPPDQLHQAVEQQETEVRAVLAEELVLKRDPSDAADVVDGETAQDVDTG